MESKTQNQAQQRRNTEAGFSLMELTIAMTISIAIIGFISATIVGFQKEFEVQQPRMEALNNAQMALETVVRVSRMAGTKGSTCTSGFAITPLTPADSAGSGVYRSLRVQADWNAPDCSLGGIEEDVSFSVTNGSFYTDAAKSEPFAEGIKELRFKFYNSSNTLITDAAANSSLIRYIQIEIDTNDDTKSTLVSGVQIRSR